MQFKEVIGHEEIKKRLIQTVRENRISHAQLFAGQEGIGKLALAIAYGQYISCTNKQETDSCGVCPSCIKYNKLIHPDLYFTYPVSTNKEVKTKPLSRLFISKWREILLQKDYIFSLQQWYQKIQIENKQGIINTEDCNEIIKSLSLKTFESEYRVVIIWMPEKLFHAAAPKLLKILEEPPPKTLFLLITESPDKILKTIISRTQIIKIPKLKDQDVKEY
nr:DNA polymerase III subunit delta [Bacteroidota bacterium]